MWLIEKKKYTLIFCLLLCILGSTLIVARAGITDEITEDLTANIADAAQTGLNGVLEHMAGVFNPSLNFFYNITSGSGSVEALTSAANATDYSYGESSLMFLFRRYSEYAGVTLATLLWGWAILFYMFSGKFTESRDNPIRVTVLYVVSLLMMHYAQDIMNYFLETAQSVWSMVISLGDGISNFRQLRFTEIVEGGFTAAIGAVEIVILGITFAPALPIVVPILMIVGVYLTWLLFKGFLRLWLEMAERYLVVCLMVFFFPIVCATLICRETAVIFKSYIRMLISQLFLIITGFIFIKGLSIIMGHGAHLTILGYIFTMAYLRTAQRLDSYMASMGLNVAQTGTGLFDSFALAAHNLGATLRGVNNLRTGTAGAMKASAIGSGNKDLFGKAALLGAGFKEASMVGSIGGLRNLGGDMHFLKESGAAGRRLEAGQVSREVAREALGNYFKNPSQENLKTLNALHNDDLVKALKDTHSLPHGINLDRAMVQANGISVSGTSEAGYTMKGTVSNGSLNENSMKTGTDAQSLYFTPEKTSSNGEVLMAANREQLNEALLATGHSLNSGLDLQTMEDYQKAVDSGNTEKAQQLRQGNMTEALYEAPFGTQCLTGENCDYGAGIPTAVITPQGDMIEYSRASDDMRVSAMQQLSEGERDSQFYGVHFTDSANSYQAGQEPAVTEALDRLTPEQKQAIGYTSGMDLQSCNGGFGIKAGYVEDASGNSHLSINYNNYDFDKSQLNSAFRGWQVAPNATLQKGEYGKSSIDMVNPATGSTAKMIFSNVAVYGFGKTNDRILVSKSGDTYSSRLVTE